ncbi:MAG: tig, partial [Jatrophihabitantaceae bacterium]|nr:tig [Jatrophihabitantaceae bacterium]
MKSTVENLGPTRVRIAVELPFEEIQSSLDAAYKSIGQQVKIPGFRPGKIPARVIDQRIGRAAVLEQAVNDALPKAYAEAVRETGVKAIGQPEIELTSLEDRESIAFTAEVDVRPDFEVPAFEALEITVDDAEVTDAQVDEQFESLRERFASLRGVQREIQSGDYVSIDLVASVNGEEVEGGSANGLSYEVGTGDLVEGLDDAIIGKSAADSVTFSTTLQAGPFAGSESEVTVTVNSVKEKDLPAPDDDFAQLASEFDTVTELRDDLREKLGRANLLTQGAQARDKALEALLAAVEIPLPASLIQAEIDWRTHDAGHALDHDEDRLAAELEASGSSREVFDAQVLETAQQSVKSQLVLDEIAEQEALTVTEAELTEYLFRQAQRYGMAPQEFANQLVQAGNLPALMADVRRNKALATVLDAIKVTDASGNNV